MRDLLDARVYDLGRELHDGIPVFPGRYFRQTLVPNGGERLGDNEVDWTIELVTATMQVGTHLDALCHLRRGDAGHDGWTLRRDTTPEGATRLGIESAPQFVTRGWLVDASGGGHVIGTDAARRHPPCAAADAVFFHRPRCALGRPRHLPRRRAGPRHGGRAVAGRPRGGADGLRHVVVRAGAG